MQGDTTAGKLEWIKLLEQSEPEMRDTKEKRDKIKDKIEICIIYLYFIQQNEEIKE